MKIGEKPTIIFDDIELTKSEVSGGTIQSEIEFSSQDSYADNFKAMAEKISDETLIEILKERDADYISEDYQ